MGIGEQQPLARLCEMLCARWGIEPRCAYRYMSCGGELRCAAVFILAGCAAGSKAAWLFEGGCSRASSEAILHGAVPTVPVLDLNGGFPYRDNLRFE